MRKRRHFGITVNDQDTFGGMIVNNIRTNHNSEVAEARDQFGKIIDYAVYNLDNQITIDGLYTGENVSPGSIIVVKDVSYIVTSTKQQEANNTFQTGSLIAVSYPQYIPPTPPIPPQPPVEKIPLSFKAVGGSARIEVHNVPSTKYKINDGAWSKNYGTKFNLNEGDVVYLSAANKQIYNSLQKFFITGFVEASGNIMSLLNFGDTVHSEFQGAFFECSGLLTAPQLPATTLVHHCYQNMFWGCKYLTAAPSILPAMDLAHGCYENMFNNCSSLLDAPSLPATGLATQCYQSMFAGCRALTSITVDFTYWSPQQYTYIWVLDVAPTGIFYKPTALSTKYGISKIPSGWQVVNKDAPIVDYNPLTFTGLSSTNVICLSAFGSPDPIVLKAKINDGEWNSVIVDQNTYYTARLNQGDTIAFSGANDHFSTYDNYYIFAMTGQIEASGNIQSLMNYSLSAAPYCYAWMFENCTSLIRAPELPATTLADNCYKSTFLGCSSLSTAPELPATTLANNCYQSMFADCQALTAAPTLPATTLTNGCYQSMFEGCYNLMTAPNLPATTLTNGCYQWMFAGCWNLSTVPTDMLPASSLTNNCYAYMFVNCISLSTAPELPATTLAEGCYWEMFEGCNSLKDAPQLPASSLAYGCYYQMFYNCTNLSSAPQLPASSLAEACYNSMFYGCISLSTAPELPATTLARQCYAGMFEDCSSLSTAPELPATTLANSCYSNMFRSCTSLSTAPSLPATTLVEECYYRMFNGCTNLSSIEVSFTVWTGVTDATYSWVGGVAANGTFYKPAALSTVYSASRIPQDWTVVEEQVEYPEPEEPPPSVQV